MDLSTPITNPYGETYIISHSDDSVTDSYYESSDDSSVSRSSNDSSSNESLSDYEEFEQFSGDSSSELEKKVQIIVEVPKNIIEVV